jgi:tRNA/tmRNA/rRNA uracil-C5-methylase (TrmA/RlmC/RlmD family)
MFSNDSAQIFEVILEKLTYGGEAMGRLPDGRAVFVSFGLPGEHVRLELTEDKKNFARGILGSAAVAIIKICPTKNSCRQRQKFYATSYRELEKLKTRL